MQKERTHQKVLLFAQILSRMVLFFILAEVVLLPFRQPIVDAYARFFEGIGISDVQIAWECTGVDETLLAVIAVLLWSTDACAIVGAALSALAVQAFNVARIVILAANPDPLLHEILFRLGGYLVVMGAVACVVFACEKIYKRGKPNKGDRHGRRGRA